MNSQFSYFNNITFLIFKKKILIILCFSPCCSMKRRRLLLSPPLLPTITETLEDLPALSTSSQSIQSSQSLEDYMTSIQALARPVETPSHSLNKFQRSHRTRHFTKGQMKLSASPRMLRTSRPKSKDYSLSGNITEEIPLKTDCRGKDPIDWLFGQIRTWKAPKTFNEFIKHFVGTSHKKKNLDFCKRSHHCVIMRKSEHLFILKFSWLKSGCLHV